LKALCLSIVIILRSFMHYLVFFTYHKANIPCISTIMFTCTVIGKVCDQSYQRTCIILLSKVVIFPNRKQQLFKGGSLRPFKVADLQKAFVLQKQPFYLEKKLYWPILEFGTQKEAFWLVSSAILMVLHLERNWHAFLVFAVIF